jgi:hypothetical protein
MSYYVKPEGRVAILVFSDSKGRELAKTVGTLKGLEPLHLKNSSSNYPSYEVITANGVADIVEHRRMEPIFYLTDDSDVWKEFAVP